MWEEEDQPGFTDSVRKRASAAVSGLRRRLSSGQVEAPSVPVHFNLLPEAEHWPNSGRVGEQRLMLVQYWRQMQGDRPSDERPDAPAPAPRVEAPPRAQPAPTSAQKPSPSPSFLREEPASASPRVLITPPPSPRVIVTPPPVVEPEPVAEPEPVVTAPPVVEPAPPASSPVAAVPSPAGRTFVIDAQPTPPPLVVADQAPVEPTRVEAEAASARVDEAAGAVAPPEFLTSDSAPEPVVADETPTVAADDTVADEAVEIDLPSIDLPPLVRPAAPEPVAEAPAPEMHFELPALERPAVAVGQDIPVEEHDVELPAGLFARGAGAPAHGPATLEIEPPVVDDLVFDLDAGAPPVAASPEPSPLVFSADSMVQAEAVDDFVPHAVSETFDVDALSGTLAVDEPVAEAVTTPSAAYLESLSAVELRAPVFEEQPEEALDDRAGASAELPAEDEAELVAAVGTIGELLVEEPAAELAEGDATPRFEEPVVADFTSLDLEVSPVESLDETPAAVFTPEDIEARADDVWAGLVLSTPPVEPEHETAASAIEDTLDWSAMAAQFAAPEVSDDRAQVVDDVEAPAVAEAAPVIETSTAVQAPPAVAASPVAEPAPVAVGVRPPTDLSDGGRVASGDTAPAVADPVWNDAKTEWTVSARDIRLRRSGVIPMPATRPARRSPLPELERFLRAARARRERVASESVA